MNGWKTPLCKSLLNNHGGFDIVEIQYLAWTHLTDFAGVEVPDKVQGLILVGLEYDGQVSCRGLTSKGGRKVGCQEMVRSAVRQMASWEAC